MASQMQPQNQNRQTGPQGKKPLPTKNVRRKKNKTRVLILVLTVFLLLAALVGGVIFAVNRYLDQKFDLIDIRPETGVDTYEVFATAPLTEIEVPETVIEDFHGQLNEKNLPLICNTDKVTNILLLATDARGNEAGLSDSMILASINEETKKIVLCSFMRDLLVLIPEDSGVSMAGKWDKLTHAHAYGGPQLTMAVLKENYNIEVDHYVKVNFNSFIQVMDSLGGVNMELTQDEIWWINQYIVSQEMMTLFPSYSKQALPYQAGVHRLNGLQALGHARNRYIGSDWARTQRQRNLISQMVTQAKGLSLSEFNSLLEVVLPLITTNIQKDMLKDLTWNAFSYAQYEITSTRLPLNGKYHEVEYNIIPDLEDNVNDLYEKIYGEPAPKAN